MSSPLLGGFDDGNKGQVSTVLQLMQILTYAHFKGPI